MNHQHINQWQQNVAWQLHVVLDLLAPDNDHCNLPHSAKQVFDHAGSLCCINHDNFGLPNNAMTPIFAGNDLR